MQTKFIAHLALLTLANTFSNVSAHSDKAGEASRKFDPSKVEATEFGQEGDPAKVTRTIRVEMADTMRFAPARLSVKQGETVKFVVRNRGKVLHEMVLGTRASIEEHAALMKRFPEMEHADANMAHVKPGANGQFVWQFNRPGEFQFACLQPGHLEAGMVGHITVK